MKQSKSTPVKNKANPSQSSSQKFKIICTDNFFDEAKSLAKKYPNIKKDFKTLRKKLQADPITGNDSLGDEVYKVRMKISDNNKGESGGARVIIQVKIIDKKVYVLSVYAKNSMENIIDRDLQHLKAQAKALKN